jgi:hypothetical protein
MENLNEIKTLVIYINSMSDTEDLSLVFKDVDCKVLCNAPKSTIMTYLAGIPEGATVIMMGHGCPSGLFGVDWEGYAVDASMVDLLKDKKCIGIWCYASDFARRHDLKGFFTSMFISNSCEAYGHGYKGEDAEIFENTRRFCKDVNRLIIEDKPFEEWIEELYLNADTTIGSVKFNYDRLCYFD